MFNLNYKCIINDSKNQWNKNILELFTEIIGQVLFNIYGKKPVVLRSFWCLFLLNATLYIKFIVLFSAGSKKTAEI